MDGSGGDVTLPTDGGIGNIYLVHIRDCKNVDRRIRFQIGEGERGNGRASAFGRIAEWRDTIGWLNAYVVVDQVTFAAFQRGEGRCTAPIAGTNEYVGNNGFIWW